MLSFPGASFTRTWFLVFVFRCIRQKSAFEREKEPGMRAGSGRPGPQLVVRSRRVSPEVPLLKLLPDTGPRSNFPEPWTLTSPFVGPFLYFFFKKVLKMSL